MTSPLLIVMNIILNTKKISRWAIAILLLVGQTSFAREISSTTAWEYAKYLLSSKRYENFQSKEILKMEPLYFAEGKPLYLVQLTDGWLLISSDDRATALLASSEKGLFEIESLPDGAKILLRQYTEEIAYVEDKHLQEAPSESWNAFYQREVLAPMVVTKLPRLENNLWRQDRNNDNSCIHTYNAECPSFYGNFCGHDLVGCVAVAVGQVLWYWRWPYIAYVPNGVNSTGIPSSTVSRTSYNWDAIPSELHTNTIDPVAQQVALLLRDCGFAAHMNYNSGRSISTLTYASDALRNVFGYDAPVLPAVKNSSDWNQRIRDEIDAQRPLLYSAVEGVNGHTFVIYGYDSDDKFYINWGWGAGYNDAAYSLSALNPPGYNFSSVLQNALFGVTPQISCDNIVQTSTPSANNQLYVTAGSISLSGSIASNKNLTYLSGEQIILQPGFHACSGCDLQLRAEDFDCQVTAMSAPALLFNSETAPRDDRPQIQVNPDLATNLLQIQTSEEVRKVVVFSITGQLMLESSALNVDLSSIPHGIYILDIETLSERQQFKFYKE